MGKMAKSGKGVEKLLMDVRALIEAVRNQTRIVDLKHINRVLIQPHWRKDYDNPAPSTPL